LVLLVHPNMIGKDALFVQIYVGVKGSPSPPFAKGGITAPSNEASPPLKKGGRGDLIEAAAQAVLDARAQFPDATLADLYDPLTMPPALVKAHQKLDAAVDAAYGKKNFKNDAERVAFLFELYRKSTSLLPGETKPKQKSPRAKA